MESKFFWKSFQDYQKTLYQFAYMDIFDHELEYPLPVYIRNAKDMVRLIESSKTAPVEEYVAKMKFVLFFDKLIQSHHDISNRVFQKEISLLEVYVTGYLTRLEVLKNSEILDECIEIFRKEFGRAKLPPEIKKRIRRKEEQEDRERQIFRPGNPNDTALEKLERQRLKKRWEQNQKPKPKPISVDDDEIVRPRDEEEEEVLEEEEPETPLQQKPPRKPLLSQEDVFRLKPKPSKPSSTSTSTSSGISQQSLRVIQESEVMRSPVMQDICPNTFNAGKPLKKIIYNRDMIRLFLEFAGEHIRQKVEFCGYLYGRELNKNTYAIQHCVIPDQKGTENRCVLTPKGDVQAFGFASSRNLRHFGWIHIHPTQDAFFSSIDCATQYFMQVAMNEPAYIGIVCAPSKKKNLGIFRIKESAYSRVERIQQQFANFGKSFLNVEDISSLYEICKHVRHSDSVQFTVDDLRKNKRVQKIRQRRRR